VTEHAGRRVARVPRGARRAGRGADLGKAKYPLPDDLRSACRRARQNRNRFPLVLKFMGGHIETKIRAMALAGNERHDAEQVARLAIWKALKRSDFDATRPNRQVQSYLSIAAERALLTFRRGLARYRARADLVAEDIWEAVAEPVSPEDNGHGRILKAYAIYYEHHGTLTGAHRYIGERLGIPPSEASEMLSHAAERARRKRRKKK